MTQVARQLEPLPLVHRPLFQSRPQAPLVSEFRRHVNDTGRPETFRAISTTKPPSGGMVKVLSEIHVSKQVRGDDTYAPCPICNAHGSQVLHGYLVWCEASEAIYAIGKECADALWEAGLLERAVSEFQQQQREASLEMILLDALPRVPLLLAWLEQHEPAAADTDRLSRAFKRSLSGNLAALEGAAKMGGQLWTAGDDGQLVLTGTMAGSAFCLAPTQAARQLNSAKQYLQGIMFGDDDAVLEYLTRMSLKEKQAASNAVTRSRQMLEKAAEQIRCAWDFTRPENLERINGWGGNQRDRISAIGGGWRVRINVGGKHWYDELKGLVAPAPIPALRKD
jgi:hypothetical protein